MKRSFKQYIKHDSIKTVIESPDYDDNELNTSGPLSAAHMISIPNLNKLFTKIADSRIESDNVQVYMKNNNANAVVGFEVQDESGNSKFASFVTLNLRKPLVDIPGVGKAVQVSMVRAVDEGQGLGYAKFLYKSIIRAGYTLISDFTQHPDGADLWKALARESSDDSIDVKIFDNNIKDFLRSDDGEIIIYDGRNIPDSKIWNIDGENPRNKFVVLIS